jgi:hypothetical protein
MQKDIAKQVATSFSGGQKSASLIFIISGNILT